MQDATTRLRKNPLLSSTPTPHRFLRPMGPSMKVNSHIQFETHRQACLTIYVQLLHILQRGLFLDQVSPSICPAEVFIDITAVLRKFPFLFTTQHWHPSFTSHTYEMSLLHPSITPIYIHEALLSTNTKSHISFTMDNKKFIIIAGFSLCEVSQSICPTEAKLDTATLEKRTILAEPKLLRTLLAWRSLESPRFIQISATVTTPPPPPLTSVSTAQLSTIHRHYLTTDGLFSSHSKVSRVAGERTRKHFTKQQQKHHGVRDGTRTAVLLTTDSHQLVIRIHVKTTVSDRERMQGYLESKVQCFYQSNRWRC